MALSAAERRSMPSSDFARPGKGKGPQGKGAGSYPIEDKGHARDALSRVSEHGSSEAKAEVRAAVHRKFPSIEIAHHTGDGPAHHCGRDCAHH